MENRLRQYAFATENALPLALLLHQHLHDNEALCLEKGGEPWPDVML